MKAHDVMTSPAICVAENAGVDELSRVLVRMKISGVPVVNSKDEIVGMVSEADLLHHEYVGVNAPRKRSRWAELFLAPPDRAAEFIKNHGRTVAEVMVTEVVTVTPDTPLPEIATVMEKNGIKRVPVVEDRKVVGIVSRENLIREISGRRIAVPVNDNDATLRDRVHHALGETGARVPYLNIFVDKGEVVINGLAESDTERRALMLAAESVQGVKKVTDNLRLPTEIPAGYA